MFAGRHLEEYYRNRKEFDQLMSQALFNQSLNRTFAHEIEHWVDVIKLGPESVQTISEKRLLRNLPRLVDHLLKHIGSPDIATITSAAAQELLDKIIEEESYDEYAEQPHEVRARNAAALFVGWESPIIECVLKK
jgi:hypothetical protein